MKPGGTYQTMLGTFLCHKNHVVTLGRDGCVKSRREQAKKDRTILYMQRDFANRWIPRPDTEIVAEGFAQDQSLGMEGVFVEFYPANSDSQKKIMVCHLTDEQRQNGDVVFTNLKVMLNDVKEQKEITTGSLSKIMDTVDGCSGQYRSGTVLMLTSLVAVEYGIVIDRNVQCSGHGKGVVDSQNGVDKLTGFHFQLPSCQPRGEG